MDQKTAFLLVVVLIAGIGAGYTGRYITTPTSEGKLVEQIATLQTQLEEKENQISTLNQQIQNLQAQFQEKEDQIIFLDQTIQNLQAQIEQQTGEEEESGFARKVIYIPCTETEKRLNITHKFEYFIGANIKLTVKNIGTEVIGYKIDGTPGDFEGYFIVRVSAQDSYGRNVTTWYLPYEFKIGQVEKPLKKSEGHWGEDITSLYPEEEVLTRVPVPYNPEEDNIRTYTIEIKYVPG